MPRASSWLVRAALVHLLVGATLGALLLVAKGEPRWSLVPWTVRGAHVDVLLVGFVLQLAFGVATWILPRDADQPPSETPAWAVLALLNAGVAGTAVASVTLDWRLAAGSRLAEAAALVVFIGHAWPRVRAARVLAAAGPAATAPGAGSSERSR